MKILKIENGRGHFLKEADGAWLEIDTIDKHALLTLLNLFLVKEVEMDNPLEHEVQNEAHKIIYSNIFEKLTSLSDNKSTFKDESERLYLEEMQKYSPA